MAHWTTSGGSRLRMRQPRSTFAERAITRARLSEPSIAFASNRAVVAENAPTMGAAVRTPTAAFVRRSGTIGGNSGDGVGDGDGDDSSGNKQQSPFHKKKKVKAKRSRAVYRRAVVGTARYEVRRTQGNGSMQAVRTDGRTNVGKIAGGAHDQRAQSQHHYRQHTTPYHMDAFQQQQQQQQNQNAGPSSADEQITYVRRIRNPMDANYPQQKVAVLSRPRDSILNQQRQAGARLVHHRTDASGVFRDENQNQRNAQHQMQMHPSNSNHNCGMDHAQRRPLHDISSSARCHRSNTVHINNIGNIEYTEYPQLPQQCPPRLEQHQQPQLQRTLSPTLPPPPPFAGKAQLRATHSYDTGIISETTYFVGVNNPSNLEDLATSMNQDEFHDTATDAELNIQLHDLHVGPYLHVDPNADFAQDQILAQTTNADVASPVRLLFEDNTLHWPASNHRATQTTADERILAMDGANDEMIAHTQDIFDNGNASNGKEYFQLPQDAAGGGEPIQNAFDRLADGQHGNAAAFGRTATVDTNTIVLDTARIDTGSGRVQMQQLCGNNNSVRHTEGTDAHQDIDNVVDRGAIQGNAEEGIPIFQSRKNVEEAQHTAVEAIHAAEAIDLSEDECVASLASTDGMHPLLFFDAGAKVDADGKPESSMDQE